MQFEIAVDFAQAVTVIYKLVLVLNAYSNDFADFWVSTKTTCSKVTDENKFLQTVFLQAGTYIAFEEYLFTIKVG